MRRFHVQRLIPILLVLFLMSFCSIALAEYGRVNTPGGPVKMRKTANAKGKLVCEIPNKTIIEADEVGEEWSHVLYNGKEGYVKTEYLKLASMNNGTGPKVTVEPQEIHVGDVVTVTVEFEGAEKYQYSVVEGKKTVKGTKISLNRVCYRPKKTGMHCFTVKVWDANGNENEAEVFLDVSEAENRDEETGEFVVYSQKDGWWSDKKYSVSNLSDSGCAIFTLSHALQRLGYTGDKVLPQNLALKYGFCLVDGGTLNETLIGRTARDFKYTTQSELIKSAGTIRSKLENGAMFTFAIVKGHIACIAGIDAGGEKVLIVDSAPSVTLERIQDGKIYMMDENSEFTEVTDWTAVEGTNYYFETDQIGGMEYYMDLSYVAKRGVRLIQGR